MKPTTTKGNACNLAIIRGAKIPRPFPVFMLTRHCDGEDR